MSLTRRTFFSLTSAFGISSLAARAWGQPAPESPPAITSADAFPQQDPNLVREIVGASHGNFARVRHPDGASGYVRVTQVWGL